MDIIPTLYVLSNDTFCEYLNPESYPFVNEPSLLPVIKIGTTLYPTQRKYQYITSSPSPPKYLFLFYLLDNIEDKDLYLLDGFMFRKFLKNKHLLHLHINKGGGTEWYYNTTDFESLIKEYLDSLDLRYEFERGDKYPLYPPNGIIREIMDEHLIKNMNMFNKQQFLQIMGLSSFRSIQEEFWEKFSNATVPFKGYVKLPTGVGKTIIIIMSLVISKIIHGNKIKAVIICPQNNIFETVYNMFEKFSVGYSIPVIKHYGEYKLISIPKTYEEWVILTSHQGGLKNPLNILDSCNFIIYDEVHHITGDKFFEMLQVKSDSKQYILGTSATPLTSLKGQKEKFETIFGTTCFLQSSYKRAIDEKWIVKPRLDITVISCHDDDEFKLYELLATKILNSIDERESLNMNKGRKAICYVPENIDKSNFCYEKVNQIINSDIIKLYNGNNDSEATEFLEVNDSNWHIMFVCQKYREGSDIRGLEMNFIIGNTSSAHTLLQTIGRTLRNDYEGKEGWSHIIRRGGIGERAWDILFKIYEELVADFDLDKTETPDKGLVKTNQRSKIIDDFIGTITIDNEIFEKERAIEQIERLYGEKYEDEREITYSEMKKYNRSKGIRDKQEYEKVFKLWPERYRIENPDNKFKNQWKSWYDFLGVDTSLFPPTLKEWEEKLRLLGLIGRKRSYDVYVEKNNDLPKDPKQMYGDYKFYPRI